MLSTDKSEMTMICGACNVHCQRFGKHRNGLRRFRCPQCKRTYTELHRRTLDAMYISEDHAILALQLLLEGNSIRSTERITKLDRNTIMSLLVRAGERCKRLMDDKMRNLHLEHLQVDEIWTYVQKKARRIRSGDSPEVGDQWVFVALDEDTRLHFCSERGRLSFQRTFQTLPRRQMCLTILYQRVLWFRSAEIQRPLPLTKIRRNVLCQFNTEIGVSVGEARTS